MNVEELCGHVCEAVKKTGEFIRTESRSFSSSRVEYKGVHDLVSYVDKNAERQLVFQLEKLLPECGFITEENTVDRKHPDYNWIIDPLDGTTNFIHGVPCYCISVALLHKTEIVIGVVYEINLDECFYAFKNGGAFLNGERISVSASAELKQSLLATGFPYTDYDRMAPYMKVFEELMYKSRGLRRMGSAAVDLAYVACGRFDGFYEYGLNPWDVAGGAIIVSEAGGNVTDFSGNKNYIFGKEILATNLRIHSELRQLISDRFNDSQ